MDWDEHDLGEVWDRTEPADFDVDLQSVKHYYPIGRALSDRVTQIAREQGVSPETLVNLWIQEKARSEWHERHSQRPTTDLGDSAASLLEQERQQREKDLA